MSIENISGHFLALTIGPIVKTLLEARKTRELWAASYLLSRLMQHLVQNLDPDGAHLLIPKIPDNVQTATLYGAGIYPDRLFMEGDHLTEEHIDTAIRISLEDLAKNCLLEKEATVAEIEQAVTFWEQFFRIRYVLAELPDISCGKLSSELSPVLDTMELEDTAFQNQPGKDYLNELFATKRLFSCGLVAGLRGANRGSYGSLLKPNALFPATHEIAAFELFEKEPDAFLSLNDRVNDEHNEAFYQGIETGEGTDAALKKQFNPRHKYFCIVQADGDNIGAAIKQLNGRGAYQAFSETLARFGQTAAGIINDYGGKPIYIGGDDLLFLAPVRSAKGSVFDLIKELDEQFPKADLHATASLSFGLNIVYYKFPLFEAIGDAYDILHKAKKFNGAQKDAVSFRFTKHSGNYFEGVFSKDFLEQMATAAGGFESEEKEDHAKMVSSLIFKLFTLHTLIEGVANKAGSDAAGLKDRIENTFDSFFNEWGDDSAFANQRKAAQNLLLRAFAEPDKDSAGRMKLFYAAMRLIQFIVSPSEKHQYDTEDIVATVG
jgi:CRISPR-associated protein Cmr2